MPKPRNSIGYTVKGDETDNFLVLPEGATLLNTTIDGGRGNDTLNLSGYSSAGVYVRIEYGFAKAKSLVAEVSFTGIFSNFTLSGATTAEGTIRNVENVIGTSGNDFLFVQTLAGVPKRVDGGPGNDVVHSLGGSATLVGGTGSDWLVSYYDNNVMIAGADDGDLSTTDGVRDYFYLGSAPTILDFEVGVDHLLLETGSEETASSYYAPGAAVWVTAANGTGSSLYVNGVLEVTLANVDAATAQSILFGLVVSPVDNVVEGGPGNDMLYAGGRTTVTSVVVGSGTGHDVIINFDLALDTLVFEDGVSPVWSNTIINGASALVGAFDGGSVTFQGLSMDDLGSMIIVGSRGTPAADTAPSASWWSVPPDFTASTSETGLQSQGDWLL